MKNQIIKNHNESVINAIGAHNSGHCKPVVRLEDMKIFSSIADAANAAGCHRSQMNNHLLYPNKNKSVKRMHYAYLRDVLDDPNKVFQSANKNHDRLMVETQRADSNAEKARLWDEYQAELRAAEEAEAKRLEDEAKAKAKRQERRVKLEAREARLAKKRAELYAQIDIIEERLEKVYDELDEIEEIDG